MSMCVGPSISRNATQEGENTNQRKITWNVSASGASGKMEERAREISSATNTHVYRVEKLQSHNWHVVLTKGEDPVEPLEDEDILSWEEEDDYIHLIVRGSRPSVPLRIWDWGLWGAEKAVLAVGVVAFSQMLYLQAVQ